MDEGDEPERASSLRKKDTTSMPNSKIMPIGPTPFSKDSINSSTFRGFCLPNIFKTPNLELLQESTSTTQTKESELTLDVRTPQTRPISVDKNQCASTSIDFESACKVMLGSTNLSMPILCGKVTHPDVENFIKSTITGDASEEVMENMAGACRTFFKESIQKYIQTIEPVIVNQCCDMVKSLWSTQQQSRGDNTLNGPSMMNLSSEHEKNMAPDSNTLCRFENFDQLEKEAPASNNSYPNEEWCEKPMTCLTCDSDMVFGKEHTCSFPDQSNGSDDILKKRDTPASLNSLVTSDKKEEDSLNISDKKKLISSCSRAKRNFMLDDDGTIFHPDSPQKKLKFPPHITAKCDGSSSSRKAECEPSCAQKSDGDRRGISEPCANTTSSSNDVNSTIATPNIGAKDGMQTQAAKFNLSELGLKKHAVMKAPGPLFNGEKVQGQRIVISKLEKDVYTVGTNKRVKANDNTECANIGRMSIMHMEFANTMRPYTWVSTCGMNVYCEALAYDQSKEVTPKTRKGFLTSAEVHHMKKNDVDIDVLKRKLAFKAIRFELDKVDMVMIPVCNGDHWWLVVANIRDKRFDVLSSCKVKKGEEQVTHIVRTNFVRAFEAMYKLKGDTKFSEFPIAYQSAPQQGTNFDCGIFVMNFMASWDGRRVARIDKDQIYNYRVKVVAYMLCHPANNKKLPAVMELMQKNEGRKILADKGTGQEKGGSNGRKHKCF